MVAAGVAAGDAGQICRMIVSHVRKFLSCLLVAIKIFSYQTLLVAYERDSVGLAI